MAASEAGNLRSTTLVSAALLVAHGTVVAWIFFNQARGWPHAGAWAYLVLFLAAPGILFHAFKLAFLWRTKRAPARRWLVRVFTIPAGLLLAVGLAGAASELARAGFGRAYAPYVAAVGAHLADPCGRAAAYFAIPSVAAYNARAARERPVATLSHDPRRFVLAFRGGSIDIDGSTIYYDSSARHWRLFHNDNAAGVAAYDQLRAGLAECTLRAER